MGTSFVEYRGFGFWTRDIFLESWLRSMLNEMAKVPAQEEWQRALASHWQTQTAVNGGCVDLGLDRFLVDDVKRDLVLSTAKGALKESRPLGQRTGELFIDLLSGKLKTTVSSPIDYLDDPAATHRKSRSD